MGGPKTEKRDRETVYIDNKNPHVDRTFSLEQYKSLTASNTHDV